MRFGITLGATPNPDSVQIITGDFVEGIRTAHAYGYNAVEIQTFDLDLIDAPTIHSVCEELDMVVAGFATGGIRNVLGHTLLDEDPASAQAALDALKGFVDKCAVIGFDSAVAIGNVRGDIPSGTVDKAPYYRKLAEKATELAQYALAKNVPITIEPINRYENNYIRTCRETADWIKEYEIPNMQILIDPFHMNIEEQSIEAAIAETRGLLKYVQVADNNRYLPGMGMFDFEKFRRALYHAGYDGIITLECLPLPDADTVAKKGLEWLQKTFW